LSPKISYFNNTDYFEIVKLRLTHPVHTKLLHGDGIGAGGDSAIIH